LNRLPLHPSLILAWGMANLEAWRGRSERIKPLHFLSAIFRILDDTYQHDAQILGISDSDIAEAKTIILKARAQLNLNQETLTNWRRKLRADYLVDESRLARGMLHRTDESRRLFERAASLASTEGARSIDLTHLLYELRRQPELGMLEGLNQAARQPDEPESVGTSVGQTERIFTPALDALGRDLTQLAREGKLPVIIGRRDEMLACARTLLRTSKRNAILVGDAGVGKTAIVEGLATYLTSGDAPDELKALRIVELSLSDIVAGTRYRGDLEERMQRVLEEAREDTNLVLFLDEIHLVVGGGRAEGAPMDIANILKPALSKGQIRCIGATTTEEYSRYIKDDAAFNRRFQILRVDEPSLEEAIQICSAWARRIEKVQGLLIEDSAIRAAVELSDRLLRDRFLPDKAIDVLENAATWVKLPSLSFKGKLPEKNGAILTKGDIVRVLEEHYGINVAVGELIDIKHVENQLRAVLVGQSDAIDELVQTMRSVTDPKRDPNRPLGVLMLIGPTGVGKTYTAELLVNLIFGEDARALGRFNMNEYKERHELARLIGAPPGFVGHGESGALFQHLQRHPQGIILLDEMEKAHPEIQDYFLQIFDIGESHDSSGRIADFRQQLIVMTANIGVGGTTARQLGFKANLEEEEQFAKQDAREILSRYFRSEFLARLDQIISFKSLDKDAMNSLLRRWVAELTDELADETDLKIELGEGVLEHLADKAIEIEQGVRGLREIFLRELKMAVYEHVGTKQPTNIAIALDGNEIVIY